MATPFKMKGHTLPGPNQKKSPMHLDPITLSALIAGGVSAATAGVGGLAKSAAKEKAEKKGKKDAARDKAQEGAAALGETKMGGKTKLTD